MADYTLHCFLQSGNAYKPALMLQLAGADWKAQFVDFMNGANRTPEFQALNEMGEVPVLIDHTEKGADGEDLVLTQSGVMLYHLCERFTDFGPRDRLEDREILRWILWDNHKMTGTLAPYRFMTHFMKQENAATENYGQRMRGALKTLNQRLSDRDWVATDRCTIADISLAGYLFWPEQSGLDMDRIPNVAAWLERIRALPNYAAPEDILPSSANA